jgi:tRNA A37 methylthiotransferase MiaB
MVGFPSETDAQFKNTLNLLENLTVVYLHVLPTPQDWKQRRKKSGRKF